MKIQKFSVGVMMTNCYFIIDEATKHCAVVDPGEDAEKLLAKLADKSLTVDVILLTHGHFDHIMALPVLKDKTGAPIAIHAADAPLFADNDKNCMRRFAGVDISMPTPDRLLSEGDRIQIGNETITVLHTPGHTPGSVCYAADDNLLTGDTLFYGSCGRSDLHGGNYNQLLLSLKRLRDLPTNYRIFPGHGASSHLDHERETNLYLN